MKQLAGGRVVDPREWREMPTPDVYFTADYYETSALAEPGFSEVVLLEWRDDKGAVWLPLIVREIPYQKYFDATSAYGYGGPWVDGYPDLEGFRQFFDLWAHENYVVATFLRFHPLLDNASRFKKILPVYFIGQTAVWDLGGSDDLVQGMAKNHRKNWRRAIRAGVEARVTYNPDNVEGFRNLYELTMDRLSAKSFYKFSDEYWKSLYERLGKDSLLVEAIHENRIVAAAWCLVGDDYIHFHLSGTSHEGREVGGAFVCRVAAAQWGSEADLVQAHHGGGVGSSESTLLEWKRKFDESVPLHNFYVANIIHDEENFYKLSEGYSEDKIFPPWRAREE